jgi:hypothetical protein|tara:strand:- start:2369 stop:2629 length:261 start_codon:yes stop_codon:yes gene_type:complete
LELNEGELSPLILLAAFMSAFGLGAFSEAASPSSILTRTFGARKFAIYLPCGSKGQRHKNRAIREFACQIIVHTKNFIVISRILSF